MDKKKMVKKNKNKGRYFENKMANLFKSLGFFVIKTGISTPGPDIYLIYKNKILMLELKHLSREVKNPLKLYNVNPFDKNPKFFNYYSQYNKFKYITIIYNNEFKDYTVIIEDFNNGQRKIDFKRWNKEELINFFEKEKE